MRTLEIKSPFTYAPVTPGMRPGYDLAATEFFLESWANRRKSARLVSEVVGDRQSKISRSKVDGHVQNFWPAIPNRKRSQTGLTWSYHQSRMVAPPVVHDRGSSSRTIGRATGRAT